MVTDYFLSIPIFSRVRKKIEKIFWGMEIIGNRRKNKVSTKLLTVLVAENCRSVQKNHDFLTPVFTFYVYFCKTFLHHLVGWTNFWSSRWSKPQQMQRNHWRSAGVWIRLMKKCEGRLSFVLERGILVSWVLFLH